MRWQQEIEIAALFLKRGSGWMDGSGLSRAKRSVSAQYCVLRLPGESALGGWRPFRRQGPRWSWEPGLVGKPARVRAGSLGSLLEDPVWVGDCPSPACGLGTPQFILYKIKMIKYKTEEVPAFWNWGQGVADWFKNRNIWELCGWIVGSLSLFSCSPCRTHSEDGPPLLQTTEMSSDTDKLTTRACLAECYRLTRPLSPHR